MSQPVRIIVPIDSQHADSWNVALAHAETFCTSKMPDTTNVVLLLHTKQQLHFTSVAGFIGATGVKLLNAGQTLTFPSGAVLRLATKQTVGTLPAGTVVIVFFADDALLEVVDDMRNLAGVIVVPDLPQSANQWIARWTPVIHGQPAKAPVRLIKDTIVENALKSVTRSINLANRALHPRDQEHVEEALRILRAKGHHADPQALRSWAIQNGWTTQAASDLERLAAKVLAMRTKPRLTDIHNPDGKYDNWAI